MKYLSSPRLMGLQLSDASLRRHFLVQCLIFLQACRVPGKNRSTGLKAKQARTGPSFLAQFAAGAERVQKKRSAVREAKLVLAFLKLLDGIESPKMLRVRRWRACPV